MDRAQEFVKLGYEFELMLEGKPYSLGDPESGKVKQEKTIIADLKKRCLTFVLKFDIINPISDLIKEKSMFVIVTTTGGTGTSY